MRARNGSAFLNLQSAADTDVEIILIKTISLLGIGLSISVKSEHQLFHISHKQLLSFYLLFVVNLSSNNSLFTIIPVVVPIDTAFATVRKRVTLSPQAKMPLMVVFWEASILMYRSSVSPQPKCWVSGSVAQKAAVCQWL